MVKINDYEIKEGLYYHKEHFWVKIEKDNVRFGITDYGQKGLREIVFVEIPESGTEVIQNEPYGTVESVKAVVDLIAPVSGKVIDSNKKISESPDTINKDPYGEGWLVVVEPSNLENELKNLMDFKVSVEFYKKVIEEG